MNNHDIDKLANAWIQLHKTNNRTQEYEDLFWSFETLDELISKNPEFAWKIILRIFELDRSDSTFMNLSAGPIEDLLVHHGDDFIDRIEEQAKRNPQFADLLGGVWRNDMSDKNWNRIVKARSRVW